MKKESERNANQIDFAVEGNRQHVARRAPRARELGRVVSVDVRFDGHAFRRFHIPNSQRAVRADAAQVLIFRVEGNEVHCTLVSGKRRHHFALFQRYDIDSTVIGSHSSIASKIIDEDYRNFESWLTDKHLIGCVIFPTTSTNSKESSL